MQPEAQLSQGISKYTGHVASPTAAGWLHAALCEENEDAD